MLFVLLRRFWYIGFAFFGGAYLIFIPFEKIKKRFPHTEFKSPNAAKAMGVLFLICGIVLIFLFDDI